MKAKFSITYETITPESAEQGDTSDHGWWMPGGWKHSLHNDRDAVLAEAQAGEYDFASLKGALLNARNLGVHEGELIHYGLLCRSVDPDTNHTTGAQTFYTLHVKGVTKSTRDRIASYLKSNGATFT